MVGTVGSPMAMVMDSAKTSAKVFSQVMAIGGYKPKFVLGDEQWSPNDIKKLSLGGNSIFRTCNFGILNTHGCYGTFAEIDGVKYTYLALFDQTNGGSYLRLSDMAFGSTGTDGMRWMTIESCNMLNGTAITSMANNGKLPGNGNLNLLLGYNSYSYGDPHLSLYYASNLVVQVSIKDSFINANLAAYRELYANTNLAPQMTKSVTCRVMGQQSCFGDTLYQWNEPDPNTAFQIEDTPINFTQ